MDTVKNIIQEFYDSYNIIITNSKMDRDKEEHAEKVLALIKKMQLEANKCIQYCEKEIEKNNHSQIQLLDQRAELYEKIEHNKKLISELDAEFLGITTEIEHIENEITKNKLVIESLQSEIKKRKDERKYWEKVWWATCWIPFANIGTGVKTIQENDEYSIRAEQVRRNIVENEERIKILNTSLEFVNKRRRENKESSSSLANTVTALNGTISFITDQINDLRAEMSICKRILEFCYYIDTTVSYSKSAFKLITDNLDKLNMIKEDIMSVEFTDKYIKGCICKGNSLYYGQMLNQNEYLLSENRRFVAVMQSDNNFVVYNSHKPIWSSETYGAQGKGYIELNGNGIVSLNGTNMSWNTKRGGSSRITMQNDGNLVAYTKEDNPIWATDTYTYSNVAGLCFKRFLK